MAGFKDSSAHEKFGQTSSSRSQEDGNGEEWGPSGRRCLSCELKGTRERRWQVRWELRR